ncbi:hypothetical protein TWF281_006199 [Arthrobotrys megalospora]
MNPPPSPTNTHDFVLNAQKPVIDEYFKECKLSTPNHEKNKICNADISESAICKILRDKVPDFESANLRNLDLNSLYCTLYYSFKDRGAEFPHMIRIYQCETEKDAENVFKGFLWGHTMPREMWPEPITQPALGSYAVGSGGMVRWVRHSIFISIELSQCWPADKLLDLAKTLDDYFAAASAGVRQKIVPKYCTLESPGNITVQSGEEFVIKVREDEDHHGPPAAFVQDSLVTDHQHSKDPNELRFIGQMVGTTMIYLVPLHKRTFHRLAGPSVKVNVTPLDESSEEAQLIKEYEEKYIKLGYTRE